MRMNPIMVFSGSTAIFKRFQLNTTASVTWSTYDVLQFGELLFLKRNAIAILYRRVKSTKKEEVVVFKQASNAGDFSVLDF